MEHSTTSQTRPFRAVRGPAPFFGDPNWTDYIVELEAKRTGGDEGFLIAIRAGGPENFYWIHFGGWGNQQHGVEVEVNGRRTLAAPQKPGHVENARWHRVRLAVIGQNLKAFLDDELIFDLPIDKHEKGGVGLGAWNTHVSNGALYALRDDVLNDFEPVALFVTQPQLILAKKTMPAKDLKEFIA